MREIRTAFMWFLAVVVAVMIAWLAIAVMVRLWEPISGDKGPGACARAHDEYHGGSVVKVCDSYR